MFTARSGWVRSIPVSTTPTTTSCEPFVISQASGASMSASGVPDVWPTLLRAHWLSSRGSLESQPAATERTHIERPALAAVGGHDANEAFGG